MIRKFEHYNSIGERSLIEVDTSSKKVSCQVWLSARATPVAVDVEVRFGRHRSSGPASVSNEFLSACRKRSDSAMRIHLHNTLGIPFYYKDFNEVQ